MQIAERERDVAAREAVVEERARIARELHDVIAHHVSMMVVQAGAERRVLGDANASTREVLETVEHTGRSALTEMRRLLGMLRDDVNEPLAPQPGLGDVPTLVEQLREAGLPIELRVDGDARELPLGIELSAYRIVQEALTNALKHAGGARATVRIRYGTEVARVGDRRRRRGTRDSRHRWRARTRRHARARRPLRRPLRRQPQSDRRLRRPSRAADPMTTILIADDQALVRVGLRKILENETDMVVVGEAADGKMPSLRRSRRRPDVV